MVSNEKAEPTIGPDPGLSLENSLEVARVEPEAAEGLRVSLRISGGVPSQRYELEFEADATGEARAALRDELTERRPRSEKRWLETDQLGKLLDTIERMGLLRIAPQKPVFLPDTLVGILEISDGIEAHRSYFAADSDQAETQDRRPPEPVQAVVEEIYELAGQILEVEDVRP